MLRTITNERQRAILQKLLDEARQRQIAAGDPAEEGD
jgi:hypothetical protein